MVYESSGKKSEKCLSHLHKVTNCFFYPTNGPKPNDIKFAKMKDKENRHTDVGEDQTQERKVGEDAKDPFICIKDLSFGSLQSTQN